MSAMVRHEAFFLRYVEINSDTMFFRRKHWPAHAAVSLLYPHYTCKTGMLKTENIEFYACITAWYSMNCQKELQKQQQKLRKRSKVQ